MNRDAGRYLAGVLLLTALPVTVQAAENNLRLYGALVGEACVIPPGDEEIRMEFDALADRSLYLNGRTAGWPFRIRLEGCRPEVSGTVNVTFRGVENAALPGLLAINAGSTATGIAIGLETPDGKALPLNKAGDRQSLQKGSNEIALRAYVRGEPEAIAEKTIGRGPFGAVATFALEYE